MNAEAFLNVKAPKQGSAEDFLAPKQGITKKEPPPVPLGLLEQQAMGKEIIPSMDMAAKEGPGGKAVGWLGEQLIGGIDATLALGTGMALWPFSKMYGLMALPFGAEVAKMAENEIASLGYEPRTKEGQEAVEAVGKGFELFLKPAHMAGEAASKISPRLGYLVELGGELAEFAITHGGVKGIKGRPKKPKVTEKGEAEIARKFEISEKLKEKKGRLPLKTLSQAEKRIGDKSGTGMPLVKPREMEPGYTYKPKPLDIEPLKGAPGVEKTTVQHKADVIKERWGARVERAKEAVRQQTDETKPMPLVKPKKLKPGYKYKPAPLDIKLLEGAPGVEKTTVRHKRDVLMESDAMRREKLIDQMMIERPETRPIPLTKPQELKTGYTYKPKRLVKKPSGEVSLETSGFQHAYESLVKNLKKEKKRGRILTREDIKIFDEGRVVKQRRWKSNGIAMKAPPIYEAEMKIIKTLPELRKKPLGGWIENAIRTFEELGVDAKELFYRPMKQAEHRVALERKATHLKINKLKAGLALKSRKRIGAYAISQQKRGVDILSEMGITTPELTPKETKVYKVLRNEFEEYYKRLNNARMLSGKDPFPKTKNYFTFFRNIGLLEEMGFNPVFTKGAALQKQFIHLKTTPFRFAKHRAKTGVLPVEIDAFRIFEKYAAPAIKHIHLSPTIAKGREFLLTFQDKKGKWILKDEKPLTAKFLTDWLDFQAGQKTPSVLPLPIEKMLMKINKNLTFSILSGMIRSALIQPSAIRNTIVEIGPKYTWEGIQSLFKTKSRDFAMEKSQVLLSRDYDIAVHDAMEAVRLGRIGNIKEVTAKLGLKPLQILDIETAKATWTGAYQMATKEMKYTERKAVNYADDVVTKTQASASPSDISPIQRSALGKSISLFQTFVINEWGFLTKDVLGIKNAKMNNKTIFKKAIGFIVGTTLVNMFYEDILKINSPYPSPIKAYQEKEGISSVISAAKELAEQIPIVGGGLRYGKGITGAGSEIVRDVIGGKKPIEAIIKLMGIPGTTQVIKTMKARKRGESIPGQLLGQYTKKKKTGRLSGGLQP